MQWSPEEFTDLKSLRDFVRLGASRFRASGVVFGHGTDNALDEALVLVAHAVNLDVREVPSYLDAVLTPAERAHTLTLLQRRIEERKPAPYLTGEAWFAGLPFHVDERVLVPRSPIAELIEDAFQPWLDPDRVERVLDLCTGSACIAIACAHTFADAQVDAVDIDAGALDVAQRNVERHHLQEQLHLYRSDLFDELPRKRYDLIVSNPPYVDAGEMADLLEEYRHEPSLGLDGGAEGLDLAVRILHDAADYLQEDGILVVEVGNSEPALCRRFPEVPFLWLDFERGGQGVFLLTAAQVSEFKPLFAAALAAGRTVGE